jgi:hemerythrin-like domain-containing protein
MAFIDFRTPAAGFEQPLELWQACHQRVIRMINLLQRLNQHIGDRGVDDDAGVTATSIRRYFDEAAPRHHDDEEIDLFPRLRRWLQNGDRPDAEEIVQTLARLEADHRELAPLWQGLRRTLTAIEKHAPTSFDPAAVSEFVRRYREHVDIEDTVIGPVLRRALAQADLDTIGQAMAQRRGVDWPQLRTGPARKS